MAYDTARPGNETYPSIDTLIREFMAGAVFFADRLRKFKLLRGIGAEPGTARPERTEAHLSELGLPSIEATFPTLADLSKTPYGLFDIAPDIGGSMEHYVLGETARSIANNLSIMTPDLVAITSEDGHAAEDLRRFADLVLYHERYLKTGFLTSIGLSAGFTAADGD